MNVLLFTFLIFAGIFACLDAIPVRARVFVGGKEHPLTKNGKYDLRPYGTLVIDVDGSFKHPYLEKLKPYPEVEYGQQKGYEPKRDDDEVVPFAGRTLGPLGP